MHPVADERLLPVAGTLALGNLGLVVGKNVVHAAAMDVDGLAEHPCRHGAALDVPAGTTLSPRALPTNGSIFSDPCLPEGKVGDGFLVVLVAGNPLARPLTFKIHMGELSILGKGGDAEVHGPILGLIGVAPIHQRADHRNHPDDLLGIGCCGIGFRRKEAQLLGILEKGLLEGAGVVGQGYSGRMGASDGFVVHIGEVHHAPDNKAPFLKMTLEEILEDVGAEVSNMGVRVNCRATGVEGEFLALADPRLDGLERSRERVIATGDRHPLYPLHPLLGGCLHHGRGECRYPFPAPEESEALVGRGLDPDA